MLNIGTKAPEFTTSDQNNQVHNLADYLGRWVLLYFYPKDDTPGCTAEACSLRDKYADFSNIKAVVLGVSGDSVKSHEKFAVKYSLPFPLLADEDKKIIKAYQANGLFRRVSYLIDPMGNIARAYDKVKPAEHAAEVLNDLEKYEIQ
jgi:peroxiredoxin Q/BCP